MVSIVCNCGASVEPGEIKAVHDIESGGELMRAHSVRCPGCGLLHILCTVDLEVFERAGRPRLGFLDELISVLISDRPAGSR